MKKLLNQGFMLVETLVVSVFVIGVLLFMFIQFQKIRSNYEMSFKYNTVNSLFATNNIRRYILSDGFESLVANLSGNPYIDLTMCPSSYFQETSYCTNLFSNLNVYNPSGTGNINKVIFTKEDLVDLKAYLNNTPVSGFSEGLKTYILGIKTDNDPDKYRLIVEYFDNTYATLKLYSSSPLYVDKTLNGADPVLDSGMIPVIIDNDGTVKKANIFSKWYDYNNKQWANVVLLSSDVRNNYNNGDIIPENKILAYFVWIPRYEYETISSSTATEIKIKFIPKESTLPTSNYIIHSAFVLNNQELSGLWVGKFEPSTNTASTCYTSPSESNCSSVNPLIKPGVSSLRYQNGSTQFQTSLKLGNRVLNSDGTITNNSDKSTYGLVSESRMIKNTEWGAVTYLAQSKYGRCTNGICDEIRINNNNTYKTGCGANVQNGSATGNCEIEYGKTTTYPQSTTNNISGIFDTGGGAWERVMGIMEVSANNGIPTSGRNSLHNSGFNGKFTCPTCDSQTQTELTTGINFSNNKYYNIYAYGTTYNDSTAYNRSIAGDATKETKGWYDDGADFVYTEYPWFVRGGRYSAGGIYRFGYNDGAADINGTFRIVVAK